MPSQIKSSPSIIQPMESVAEAKDKQTEKKIIKGIKQLYDQIVNLEALRIDNASGKKIENQKRKIENLSSQIFDLQSEYKTLINEDYEKLFDEYKQTGNRRKILSVLNYKTPFEKKLNSLHSYYNKELDRHYSKQRQIENKIDVLEDERQYFKKSWKHKISKYETRIQKLNEALRINQYLINLDEEIKVVISDFLSELADLKNTLKKQHEELYKEQKKET